VGVRVSASVLIVVVWVYVGCVLTGDSGVLFELQAAELWNKLECT